MSGLSSLQSRIFLIGTAIAAAFPAPAEEFSWQLSGSTRHTEGFQSELDTWAVDGTYYMNPVDDSAGPYALASFLNPTTRLSAAASGSDSNALDDPAYTLSGAYVLPGERWYVGANYAKANVDDSPYTTWSDQKGYGILAGRYLGASTTLELGLGRSEHSFETSLPCPPGAQSCGFPSVFAAEVTTDSLGLEVFHVRRFRSLTYSLTGSVSERDGEMEVSSATSLPFAIGDGEPLRVYSVAAELFPTNRLGVRVGYSQPDIDDDVDSYDVSATWFFKPRVAIEFGLSRATNGNSLSGGEVEGAGVRIIGRL
jgi:hypothetical protein